MSRTLRIYNNPRLKKTRRIDIRTYEIPYNERKSTDHSGFEFHPYKQIRMHCSSRCAWCNPRSKFHGAQRAARRSNKFFGVIA